MTQYPRMINAVRGSSILDEISHDVDLILWTALVASMLRFKNVKLLTFNAEVV